MIHFSAIMFKIVLLICEIAWPNRLLVLQKKSETDFSFQQFSLWNILWFSLSICSLSMTCMLLSVQLRLELPFPLFCWERYGWFFTSKILFLLFFLVTLFYACYSPKMRYCPRSCFLIKLCGLVGQAFIRYGVQVSFFSISRCSILVSELFF